MVSAIQTVFMNVSSQSLIGNVIQNITENPKEEYDKSQSLGGNVIQQMLVVSEEGIYETSQSLIGNVIRKSMIIKLS